MNPGKVMLVGAGPGDPDLLTVKAVKALQAATVLLVDDLVSDDIVALANPAARVIYVGKRGGCKSTPPQRPGTFAGCLTEPVRHRHRSANRWRIS